MPEKKPGFLLKGDQMELRGTGLSTTVPIKVLPQKMITWIDSGRQAMYSQLSGKSKSLPFFAQHLPMITTYNPDSVFPFNCGNKGVGFIPKMEYLDDWIKIYQEVFNQTQGIFWKDSLEQRLAVASRFNFDAEVIDYRCLATLEIFEKQTYSNLCKTPMASLLYTGSLPRYISYQVNAGVEVIGQNDPRHTFIMLSRILFEYDNFHIAQPQFPHAYIFWVSEVHDKTPVRVEEQPDKNQYLTHTKELMWDKEAVEAINKAPGMIRQYICQAVEKYARERGFTQIDLDFVMEAKKSLSI